MAIHNIKLTICYDGSEYHGWQIQPGLRTVQGVLTGAIHSLLGDKVRVCGASRTDAGVSALGQVGLIQIDSPIPTENLARAITDRLPEDMAVTEAIEVPRGFDIIGAVKSKLYRYTIFTGSVRPVMLRKHCWHVPARLDVPAIDKAAQLLIGKKDFKSFASAKDTREDTVRTVFCCNVASVCFNRDASYEKVMSASDTNSVFTPFKQYSIRNTQYEGDWIYIDVEGDRFLYNMVRNIVGTLIEIGIGRWKPEKVTEILDAKDRRAAGPLAPAAGLCLMQVKY
jgi:tRNA pseudouridine38-40 synthase